MKFKIEYKASVIILSVLVFLSCSKDEAALPPDQIAPFIANWKVAELVQKSTINGVALVGNYNFNSNSVKLTDSTFGLVQSRRMPVPDWVGYPGVLSADTLRIKPVLTSNKLIHIVQASLGLPASYSANKDTLNLVYWFGVAGGHYVVTQTWVKL